MGHSINQFLNNTFIITKEVSVMNTKVRTVELGVLLIQKIDKTLNSLSYQV